MEGAMPKTSSEERPLKRQKSCIDYCLQGTNDDSEQVTFGLIVIYTITLRI
jgi:hypothetical protein